MLFTCGALVGLAGSCAGTEQSLGPHLAGLESELVTLDSLRQEHLARIESAAEMAAVRGEESSYVPNARQHGTMMMHHMESMGGCSHDKERPQTEAMHNELMRLSGELDRHAAAMASATSTVAARAEEAHHSGTMSNLGATLRAEHGKLNANADRYSCPMSSGQH